MRATTDTRAFDVVVVGGGLAGLHAAWRLACAGKSCLLLESRSELGGRVRTVFHDGAVAYEAGPWRVPSAHRRVRALLRSHRISLAPVRTPALRAPPMARATGHSTWEANALQSGIAAAHRLDGASGYVGQTHAASGSAPYAVDDGGGREHYDVAPKGFSTLVERLRAALERTGRVSIHCQARMVDVTKHGAVYTVSATHRRGHNRFVARKHRCSALFLCVPPRVLSEVPLLFRYGRPTLERVAPGALNHIYARHASPDHIGPFHSYDADGITGQTISGQYYGQRWFQASYSSNWIAHLWNNMRLQSARRFAGVIKRLVWQLYGLRTEGEPRMHFWETAYHAWHPTPDFDLSAAVLAAVELNRTNLHRVYVAGEAFSSHQAWMEGAIETADLAVDIFLGLRSGLPEGRRGRDDLSVDGRLLSATSWADRHPGGAAALAAHAGENVSELMRLIGHSPIAWRTVAALQHAWEPPAS